jgi:tRNA A-37 threonylcarbamoyl transferase component Bud32
MPSAKELKGKSVGRYGLIEHLASGGMAEIYLASHESEGAFAKELVLKILQSRYAENPDVVKMFLDEARLGAKLNHPNIVDVYDLGSEDGLYYIAMEHIPGKTLTDVVRRAIEVSKPLTLEHAAYLMAETAAGLAYMHDGTDPHGRPFRIVHRDISPSNLIISMSGQLKIIDFGIARETEAPDASGARPGKVSYMSPEQVRGGELDGRSDIFSLGTILYEITLGRRLWRGPKEVVMRRIVEEKPAPPTYVNRNYPPELELIVLRALEKRPENRHATAGELFEELEAYLVSSGARTRNHQIAQYLQDLFAPDAEVSEMGIRRARDYLDDDGVAAADELDFDRPAKGAGKAFADALRSAGPYVPTPAPPPNVAQLPVAAAPSGAVQVAVQRTPETLEPAPTPPPAAPPQPVAEVEAPAVSLGPRHRRLGLILGLLIVSAAALGLLLALGRV